jgi:hypothetical protein
MNFFLKWLLNHFLFAGTLFFGAGAAVLGDTGADVANLGAEGQGEGGGGGLGEDAGRNADDLPSSEQTGDEEVQGAEQKPTTHRAVLENFTKSEEFKALQAQKPEVAKAITKLQQSLASLSRSLSSIGGLKEVPRLAEAISKVGGLEAISEMQGRIAEIDEIDAKLAAGDPAYITDIATNMPEEFSAMMPPAIDKWAETNPEAFTHLIAQNVVGSLFSDDPDSPGIAGLISRAHELAGAGKAEEAQKLLKTVYAWCKNVANQAKAKPNAKTITPDAKRLTERETQLAKREQETFDKSAWSQVDGYTNPLMRSEIKRQFGKSNVSDETISDMMSGVMAEMTRKAQADSGYQNQIKVARTKKDQARLVQLGKDFATKNVADVVKLIYGRRYRGMNIPQQVAKNKVMPANGVKVVTAPKAQIIAVKPKDSDLQLKGLSGDQMKQLKELGFQSLQQAIMNNIAFTRTGKLIQWQRDR